MRSDHAASRALGAHAFHYAPTAAHGATPAPHALVRFLRALPSIGLILAGYIIVHAVL